MAICTKQLRLSHYGRCLCLILNCSFVAALSFPFQRMFQVVDQFLFHLKVSKYAGTLITVTCSPSSAYQFSSISIVKQDGTTVGYTTITSGSNYTFIIPSGNVTVNVNYSLIPTYSINLTHQAEAFPLQKLAGLEPEKKLR